MTLTDTELRHRAEALLRSKDRPHSLREGVAKFTSIRPVRTALYAFLGVDVDPQSFGPISVAAYYLELNSGGCFVLAHAKDNRVITVSASGVDEAAEFAAAADITIEWQQ